jgi:hypothetical protein
MQVRRRAVGSSPVREPDHPNRPLPLERSPSAAVNFRNEIVTGPGGQQIMLEDPSGHPIELFQPAGSVARAIGIVAVKPIAGSDVRRP